ncbi:MAG: glycosyltransferase family 4 protein [Candidatus Sumerlaeaceae bacterium]|nr:glycosyltransferase family 4 protein [Candidatus Sumerlaeaceae bacterium]
MRILFLHQHYYPETVGTSTRAVEIAEHLVSRGHEVVFVTGQPCHPSTMRSGEVGRRQPRFEVMNGVVVHRVWTFGSGKPDTFWRRMLMYASFMVTGGLKALLVPGPFDLMVAVSPLPNGIAGLWVSRLRRLPLMFDVCDIWPDCAEAVGMLRNRILVALARALEKSVYRRARRIGVVTRGFTGNLVAKGVPRDKVVLLPDWVDLAVYDSTKAPREATRAEFGIQDRFVVSFLGNFGLLMGIEQILETAREVQSRASEILFLFVGKGVCLPMMEQRIREWNLTNVRIIPYQPRAKVPAILAASDALIVTYIKNDITLITTPSKIYEYMASERPIVAGVEGVIREILEEADCGLVSPGRDPGEMAGLILRLRREPELRVRLGRNGRLYAAKHFTFQKVAADYEAALIDCVTCRPGAVVAARSE